VTPTLPGVARVRHDRARESYALNPSRPWPAQRRDPSLPASSLWG
jgi:hypothetical protein